MLSERFGIRNRNHRRTVDPIRDQHLIELQARRTRALTQANRRTIHIPNDLGGTIERQITVPSEFGHYSGVIFDWDTRMAVSMKARDGFPYEAGEELSFLMKFVDPQTGFLSNKVIADETDLSPSSRFEALFANDPKHGNSYTQPPLHAWAGMEVYDSYKRFGREKTGKALLEKIYGTDKGLLSGLKGAYAFFQNHRQNGENDPLIGNIDPRETGRDTDHACDMEGKKIGVINTTLFMINARKRGSDPEGKRKDWLPEKMREKYWLNDVMMNTLYVNNLRYLSQISDILGEEHDKNRYAQLANAVERQILFQSRMWQTTQTDPAGFYYNLNKDKQPILIPSITGLFPLLLDNIPQDKVSVLLDKIEDPNWFGTKYPLPSHPVSSPYYREKNTMRIAPPWDGPVWINLNHFIVEEGLVKQAKRLMNEGNHTLAKRCIADAEHIVRQTTKLQVQNTKPMEAYDADGTGIRVRGFLWSNLRFEKFSALQKKLSEEKNSSVV